MRTNRAGITLIEVIVVIAIVTTLSALLYLAIGPRAKRGAIETRIRSDLRQLTASISIYRADYDDGYPPQLDVLPAGTPINYPNWPEQSELCPGCQIGEARYSYWYTHRQRELEKYYDIGARFDEAENAIVDARFYQIETDQKQSLPEALEGGGFRETHIPLRRVLGVKTDGSVSWKPLYELWQWRIMEFGLYPIPPKESKDK